MKTKLISIFAVFALIISAGCERTDFDEILRRQENQLVTLNDHEARIKALETLVKTTNEEIKTIKGLVEALQKKVSIVSYRELADGSGYELIMSDNTKMVLKHGAKGDKGDTGATGAKGDKGDAPALNVAKHTDGRYYWTLNGDWMLDGAGKMIPATGDKGEKGDTGEKGNTGDTGAAGANGYTPQMRVNTSNQWEVSLDGGTTWQLVKDAGGNPVAATGADGKDGMDGTDGVDGIDGKDGTDGATGPIGPQGPAGPVNLTITETATAITIVYNGVTYTIPKGEALPAIDPAKLIGKWLWKENQIETGGVWAVGGYQFPSTYWVQFIDATNAADEDNAAMSYTLTGNKLEVSVWDGDFTVIEVTDTRLVLERVFGTKTTRQIYTKDTGI